MYKVIFLLFIAAFLEVMGDAILSHALHHSKGMMRFLLCFFGGGVLCLYGLMVNLSSWDFGRLLGIYVIFFFIIAQFISCLMTRSYPSFSVICAGCLMMLAGFILTIKA